MCSLLEKLNVSKNLPDNDRNFLSSHYAFSEKATWCLTLDKGAYCLTNESQRLALTLDFRTGNYQHRNTHPAKEPLVKAIKIKQKLPDTLIDATPGVLKDALMLVGRGVRVTAIERNPLLFIIVRKALSMLEDDSLIDYHFGDACQRLSDFSADIIYLDPMYPRKKKNAQVKKDMQVLHHIVGNDADANKLLAAAKEKNTRVIVKRPSYAEPLANEKPSFISQIGATRFDVYLPNI